LNVYKIKIKWKKQNHTQWLPLKVLQPLVASIEAVDSQMAQMGLDYLNCSNTTMADSSNSSLITRSTGNFTQPQQQPMQMNSLFGRIATSYSMPQTQERPTDLFDLVNRFGQVYKKKIFS